MKQKVKWSKNAWVITCLVTLIIAVALIITRYTAWRFYILVGITAIVFISMWIWSPTSISVDDEFITIHKRIGRKRIPLSNIHSVTRYTLQVDRCCRLCGSGGFAGYWGWFHDPHIGNYFGYYGNKHDCFRVQLNNGRQYILGCENVCDMVIFLTEQIKKIQRYEDK